MAANIGGSVFTKIKTFDVSLPEVEAYLQAKLDNPGYAQRQIIGVESLGPQDYFEEKMERIKGESK
jgi:hypothetical protein